MTLIKSSTLLILFFLSQLFSQQEKEKTAIVLASFGSTYPQSLNSILNIGQKVKSAFPHCEVKHAFTSNFIRKKWQERRNNKEFIKKNKGLSQEFLYVKNPLATIAELQNDGYKTILVQPTHIFAGESYYDLVSHIEGLQSIKTIKEKYKPFKKIAIGRPALGKPGIEHEYLHDLKAVAKILGKDVEYAAKKQAALVYVGHGNEHFSTGVYSELQYIMQKMYRETKTYIGNVEGFPHLQSVIYDLQKDKISKVVLKPLMIVAGEHTVNDIAGNDETSWKSQITRLGIGVECVKKGLGENDQFAELFVAHLKDIAK